MTYSEPSINDRKQEKPEVRFLQNMAKKAMDTILPERCFSCGEIVGEAGGLCGTCWSRITFVSEPFCQCCGRPFEFEVSSAQQCASCLKHPPVYERARSCMVYDDASRGVILAFKHADRTDMTKEMAAWLARAGDELIQHADLIAPVPLHWTRMWSRKYNQSAELARYLAAQCHKPYAPGLIKRKRRTPSQAGLKAAARAKNVRGAFAVSTEAAQKLENKRVILVDDVMTTGSTLSACAGTLLWAGAVAVDVLTLARVVRLES